VRRTYVLTLRLTTDQARIATILRHLLKRVAGGIEGNVGVRVTTQTQDGPVITEPVVLMERIVE
jgi:hypothetical protein